MNKIERLKQQIIDASGLGMYKNDEPNISGRIKYENFLEMLEAYAETVKKEGYLEGIKFGADNTFELVSKNIIDMLGITKEGIAETMQKLKELSNPVAENGK
jgi:hypothetical protein